MPDADRQMIDYPETKADVEMGEASEAYVHLDPLKQS